RNYRRLDWRALTGAGVSQPRWNLSMRISREGADFRDVKRFNARLVAYPLECDKARPGRGEIDCCLAVIDKIDNRGDWRLPTEISGTFWQFVKQINVEPGCPGLIGNADPMDRLALAQLHDDRGTEIETGKMKRR